MNYRNQFIIATSIVVVFISGVILYDANTGYKVIFNSEEIGMVKEQETLAEAVEVIKTELCDKYNLDIVFDQDVKFEKAFIDKDNLLVDVDKTVQAVYSTDLGLSVNGAVLIIDGEEVVSLASEEEVQMVIDGVLEPFTKESIESKLIQEPEIEEEYAIAEKQMSLDCVMEVDQAIEFLSQGTNTVKEYKVKNGDTTWDIAVNRGVQIGELEKANPNKDISKLHDGDVINLTAQEPYLTVMTVKEEKIQETVQYNTVYKDDSSLYIGMSKVVSEGINGVIEKTSKVNFENGVEVSREVTGEEIIKNPQDKVIAKGTKELPLGVGTGRFQIPTIGRISVINKPGSHSGNKAVDIANSVGTSIRASDGGRVTKASDSGNGYGKCIIIDHGNGYKTLYAHLNSYDVSVGSQVSKGQQIGTMGNTGNSRGSHLHFEVIKNGARQTITDYFNLSVGLRVSP